VEFVPTRRRRGRFFKREPKTSKAKKACIAAAAPAKAAKKAAKKASFQPAAKAHRQTTNLRGRHSTFHVKANHPNLPARNFSWDLKFMLAC